MPTFRQDNKLGDSVPLIKTPDIGDKQVTERKLADGSVTSSKLSTEIANMLSLLTTRISAFKVADNLSSLPTEENTIGWLVDNHLYVYVGNGSTPESGMYQDCGELRGPQGIQGEQGLSGLNGKSAYDIWAEKPGNEDKSEIDFLEFTRGSKGDKGDQGERGYDISNIEQIVKSTEDGGKNIIRVTRSDGWSKVFEILNGSKGSKGDKGTSIVKLEQTRKTTESSGLNTIEATLGDGTKESFEIYNGAKGEQGDKGEKGDKGDQGEIGPQGNSGIADASNKTLVNDAITGGETDFLSAEVGKLGILTYDCSKGGTVTHTTLQDAINSVPTTFQKVGLTITYKSGYTIYRYTLKANAWSADPTNWFSVEDKLSDLSDKLSACTNLLDITEQVSSSSKAPDATIDLKALNTSNGSVSDSSYTSLNVYRVEEGKKLYIRWNAYMWRSANYSFMDSNDTSTQRVISFYADPNMPSDKLAMYNKEIYVVVPKGAIYLYVARGKDGISQAVVHDVVVNSNVLDEKIGKGDIVQKPGEAEDKVMSQKAVSDKLSDLSDKLSVCTNLLDITEQVSSSSKDTDATIDLKALNTSNGSVSDSSYTSLNVYRVEEGKKLYIRWNAYMWRSANYSFMDSNDTSTQRVISFYADPNMPSDKLAAYNKEIYVVVPKGASYLYVARGKDGISQAVVNDVVVNSNVLDEIVEKKCISCYGDSLMEGVGADRYYAIYNYLKRMLGSSYTVRNLAVGGESSRTIASRQGGMSIVINNITIPKSGMVVIGNSDDGLTADDGEKVYPWIQNYGDTRPLYINNKKVNVYYNAYNDKLYRLEFVDAQDEDMIIDRPTEIITKSMKEFRNEILIIWIGQNGGYKDVADWINQIKRMIDYNGNNKYLVLGRTSLGNSDASVESEFYKAFGRHYVNLRKYLVKYGLSDNNLSATEEDEIYIEQGKVPKSLLSDSVHFNNMGYDSISKYVFKRGQELLLW